MEDKNTVNKQDLIKGVEFSFESDEHILLLYYMKKAKEQDGLFIGDFNGQYFSEKTWAKFLSRVNKLINDNKLQRAE